LRLRIKLASEGAAPAKAEAPAAKPSASPSVSFGELSLQKIDDDENPEQ
jgi:twitching motility protein PilU